MTPTPKKRGPKPMPKHLKRVWLGVSVAPETAAQIDREAVPGVSRGRVIDRWRAKANAKGAK